MCSKIHRSGGPSHCAVRNGLSAAKWLPYKVAAQSSCVGRQIYLITPCLLEEKLVLELMRLRDQQGNNLRL